MECSYVGTKVHLMISIFFHVLERVAKKEDVKGIHKRIDVILRAVARVEGSLAGRTITAETEDAN